MLGSVGGREARARAKLFAVGRTPDSHFPWATFQRSCKIFSCIAEKMTDMDLFALGDGARSPYIVRSGFGLGSLTFPNVDACGAGMI